MKPSLFILFVAAMLEATCAIGLGWELKADAEITDTDHSAVRPPNGLRRAQVTMDLSGAESDITAGTSASDASSTTETEAPATIMVLLPDNLATSYSDSGSVMFFDGAVGDEVKNISKSAGSDIVKDEASNAASVDMATAVTAFTMLFAFVMA